MGVGINLLKFLEVNYRIKMSFVCGSVVLPFDSFDHPLNVADSQKCNRKAASFKRVTTKNSCKLSFSCLESIVSTLFAFCNTEDRKQSLAVRG